MGTAINKTLCAICCTNFPAGFFFFFGGGGGRNEYTCCMWQVLAVTYMIDRNPCLHGFEFLLGNQFLEVAVRHENGSLSTAIVLVGLVAKKQFDKFG